MIWKMVLEILLIKTEIYIQDNGSITLDKEMGLYGLWTIERNYKEATWENGVQTRKMEEELCIILMETNMKAFGLEIKKRALEYMCSLTMISI